jgi:4-hydroxy-2-oxoheptanedioate aldolase
MINRLKQLLATGKPAIGTMVQMPSASVVEVLAQAGFDWLVIDAEHGPIDIESVHAMVRATAGTAVTPTVRIPSNLEWLAKRALDVGALGVMVPGVDSAAEAQPAVRAVRYPPQGTRGFGPTFAGLRWNLAGADYASQANDAVTAILQIEHIDAVARIDEILAVPGVDVALIGPFDLSGSMGLLGQVGHPDVQAAIARVLKAAQKANVAAGIFGVGPDDINRYIAQGFRAMLLGVDVAFLTAGAKSALSQVKR